MLSEQPLSRRTPTKQRVRIRVIGYDQAIWAQPPRARARAVERVFRNRRQACSDIYRAEDSRVRRGQASELSVASHGFGAAALY